MQVGDIDRVVAIDQMSFSLPWSVNSYRYELVENKHSHLWVAETNGSSGTPDLVGAVVVWLIVDEAHIATLAVHPAYRRLGIGQRLLEVTLKDALNMKMVTATLEVRTSNLAAQALYQKFGFQVVGRRLRYYQDTKEDALIMTVYLKHIPPELLMQGQAILVDKESDCDEIR